MPPFGRASGQGLVRRLRRLLVWALSYLYAALYVHAGVLVYPPRLTWLPVAWSLIEVPVATIAGAWIYRE